MTTEAQTAAHEPVAAPPPPMGETADPAVWIEYAVAALQLVEERRTAATVVTAAGAPMRIDDLLASAGPSLVAAAPFALRRVHAAASAVAIAEEAQQRIHSLTVAYRDAAEAAAGARAAVSEQRAALAAVGEWLTACPAEIEGVGEMLALASAALHRPEPEGEIRLEARLTAAEAELEMTRTALSGVKAVLDPERGAAADATQAVAEARSVIDEYGRAVARVRAAAADAAA